MAHREPTAAVKADLLPTLGQSLATASGTVAELGWELDPVYPNTVVKVHRIASVVEALERAPELDAVVSLGVLWGGIVEGQDDPFVQLVQALAPSGRLYFCEPTLGLGVTAAVQGRTHRWLARRQGYGHGRDVPALIRSAGMRLTTIHRIRAGRGGPLASFTVGEARWYPDLSEQTGT